MNINKIRHETPACQELIHFNNAGAALPPKIVVDSIKEYLDLEASIGGYEAFTVKNNLINEFYENTSRLINCKPHEIAFMESATRAWDMAFYGLNLKKGDKILTAQCEYASNYLAFLHKAKTTGVEIKVISNEAFGQLDVQDLEAKIDKSVKLIAITHIPTNGGLINPAQEIGIIAKKYKIPYLLDATQSIGQMPMDVTQLHCDFLCATGRKYLRGPRGTGFLYANSKIIEQCNPPFIDLHSAKWIGTNQYAIEQSAQHYESWEQYVAGKIGFKRRDSLCLFNRNG